MIFIASPIQKKKQKDKTEMKVHKSPRFATFSLIGQNDQTISFQVATPHCAYRTVSLSIGFNV